MPQFWSFAAKMLRYRAMVALSFIMAILSAGTLGVGLVGLGPILKSLLGKSAGGLPQLAQELNAKVPDWAPPWLAIPDSIIQKLPDGQSTAVAWIMGGLCVLTAIGAAATFLHAYLSLTVVNLTTTTIRRDAFRKVLRSPLKDIVLGGPSDAISRIMQDTAAISGGFNALLSKAVSQVAKGAGALVAAFFIDWRLAALALAVGPVLFVIIRKLGKRIRRASKAALVAQSGLYHAAAESLQGLRVVKVHTTERYEAGRFHRMNKDAMRELNRVRTARALASPLVEALTLFAIAGLTLIAINNIRVGAIDPGAVVQVIVALGAAGASFKPLTGLVNDVQASAAAAERLAELMKAPTESGHEASLPKLPRHHHSVMFDHVTFTYPTAPRPALSDISLTINHGETVAVVGPNGSGKTTLLALVPRLFDPDMGPEGRRGRILIDAHDISRFSVRSLRRQIGVVTQETVLFKGTIRHNIAYGAEAATDAAIVAAAKRARAHDFITALPNAYDTMVAEQGLTLSGGQRQRIAIARAILRDPSILILDEATSMIDADSEAQIADALADFAKGRTSLIVAHRLSTVLNADRIIVMDQGKVVDLGSHAELLQRCPVYRLIADRQLLPPIS
ncbi:MAG: ABC transporter ATP-binding protein [Phycisphaerae bacterium]|nr:ABC transporter ATP-binding protein [Phycisphaerae bacterium]